MKKAKPIELLCVFQDDGRPICLRPADFWVGRKATLCKFHAGFMYSTDYSNSLPKARPIKRAEVAAND